MEIVKETIELQGEQLVLSNQRAMYWPAQKALILSDLHVGKTAHFRKHGIPIPDDIFKEDLRQLEGLINHFEVQQVLIVGDLIHAEANKNMDEFAQWRHQFNKVVFRLIKGNHDRLSDSWIFKFNLEVTEYLKLGPFLFVHDPQDHEEDGFVISGHIHPGVLVKGKGRQKIKLPCYAITESELVLPAFSRFTGLNSRYSKKNTVHYAFTDNAFFKF